MKKMSLFLIAVYCFCSINISAFATVVPNPQHYKVDLLNVALCKPINVSDYFCDMQNSDNRNSNFARYINDNSEGTVWKTSNGNGGWAVIDLCRNYPVSHIELMGISVGATVSIGTVQDNFQTLELTNDTYCKIDLSNDEIRYIKISKQSSELQIGEVRVFAEKEIDTEVVSLHKEVWTSANNPNNINLSNINNDNIDDFVYVCPYPNSKDMRITIDLGSEYAITDVELFARNSSVVRGSLESFARRDFEVWVGNGTDISADFSSNGIKIGDIGSQGYGPGGSCLSFSPNSKARFVMIKKKIDSVDLNNPSFSYLHFAEIKVYALKSTAKTPKATEDKAGDCLITASGDNKNFINDKNESTYWSDSGGNPEFVMDLGDNYTLRNIKISTLNNTRSKNNYKIIASINKNFDDCIVLINKKTGGTNICEKAINYENLIRYVKFIGNTKGTTPCGVNEVNLFCEKSSYLALADGKTSSISNGSVFPTLTDGDVNTKESINTQNSYLAIDLGYPIRLDKISISSDKAVDCRLYNIYGSNKDDFGDAKLIHSFGAYEYPSFNSKIIDCDNNFYKYILIKKIGSNNMTANSAFSYPYANKDDFQITLKELTFYTSEQNFPYNAIQLEKFEIKDSKSNEKLNNSACEFIKADCVVKNSSREIFKPTVICAIYNDNKLSGLSFCVVPINAGEIKNFSLNITNSNFSKPNGTIKCFLWSDIDGFTPLPTYATFYNGIVNYAKQQNEFYVSTTGTSDGDGSKENPFDSLNTAKNHINTVKHSVNSDITVHISEGQYNLTEPFVLNQEDSGAGNHKIIYSGSNSGETIISGGKRLLGWKSEGNNIYSINLPNNDYVRELYVNNCFAKRSRSENIIYGLNFYNNDGIVIPYDKKLENISPTDGCELLSTADWRELRLKINRVEQYPNDASKQIIFLENPEVSMQRLKNNFYSNLSDGTKAGYGFNIENTKGLLDRENEFYFDKTQKKLYYKTFDGINPDQLNMYIPILDKLVLLKGNNSKEKVENIEFNNLIFEYTTWQRVDKDGYVPFQGAMFYSENEDKNNAFPQIGMVPAAIQMDMAENIGFKNNIVACSGNVGIGLYNGIKNADISGNIVTQTAHGGITVGLSSHMYADTINNVAYRKPAVASSFETKYPPLNITDGDKEYFWSSGNPTQKNYCQIDLQKKYSIDSIGIHSYGAVSEERKNFEVWASNDENFGNYSVIVKVDDNEIPGGTLWKTAVSDKTPYRFVRYVKNGKAAVGDLCVYSYDDGDVLSKQECTDDIISNNYISNIGLDFPCAVGIQGFYTGNLKIANNTIQNVPYSGISLGWGWVRTPECNVAQNNSILNNKIINCMKRCRDGGGIYTLGQQPNMIIENNYIKNPKNFIGGIYPDEGTNGLDRPISIKNNVIENSCLWFMGWQKTIDNIKVANNYTTSYRYRNDMGNNSTVLGTKVFVESNPTAEISAIISNSGFKSEYNDIFKKLRRFSEDGGKYDLPQIVNQIGGGKLLDTFSLEQPGKINNNIFPIMDTNTADYYVNYGNTLPSDTAITKDLRNSIKVESLQSLLGTYEYYRILLADNPSWLENYQTQYNILNDKFAYIKSVWKSTTVNPREIYEGKIKATKALEEFTQSGIFKNRDTTRILDKNLEIRITNEINKY